MEQNNQTFSPGEAQPLSTFDFRPEGKPCRIRIFSSDLTLSPESYDVVACSVFKGDYAPFRRTLVGALDTNRGISVAELAKYPDISMQTMGCWLSAPVPGPIRRIACLELLDWDIWANMRRRGAEESGVIRLLKSTFLSLRHLLETAAESGIEIRRIAMPVLGAGNQGIDPEYIAVPLFSQCMKMFRTIETLDTIDFYELNRYRAEKLNEIIRSMVPRKDAAPPPSVFISYSSKQMVRAHSLRDTLEGSGFSVWIAPEGIPTGSSYLAEIPAAISNAKSLVLMLTEDAMRSQWVIRETAAAVGAGKKMIPAQLNAFDLTEQFRFLLGVVQILPLWSFDEREQDARILTRLKE